MQTAKLVGDRPVSGNYSLPYNHYGEPVGPTGSCMISYIPQCYYHSSGRIVTHLRTYKLHDGLKRYDFYLLDITGRVKNAKGNASDNASAYVGVQPRGVRIVDHVKSGSLRARSKSCRTYSIDLGLGFGPISAGTQLGSVDFCSKTAHLQRDSGGWTMFDLAATRTFDLTELVKVPRGKHPYFKVTLATDDDHCTLWPSHYDPNMTRDWCISWFDAGSVSTHKVTTTGS